MSARLRDVSKILGLILSCWKYRDLQDISPLVTSPHIFNAPQSLRSALEKHNYDETTAQKPRNSAQRNWNKTQSMDVNVGM